MSARTAKHQALKQLGGKQPNERYVLVHVDGLGSDSVQFFWAEGHPDHVAKVNLLTFGSKAHSERDEVIGATRKQLGFKFEKAKRGYGMASAGLWIDVGDNAGNLLVRTDPTSDVHWKERLDLEVAAVAGDAGVWGAGSDDQLEVGGAAAGDGPGVIVCTCVQFASALRADSACAFGVRR